MKALQQTMTNKVPFSTPKGALQSTGMAAIWEMLHSSILTKSYTCTSYSWVPSFILQWAEKMHEESPVYNVSLVSPVSTTTGANPVR